MAGDNPRRITLADMKALVEVGAAEPLLREYDGGPTHYDGVWWYIRKTDMLGDFELADPQLSAVLDGMHEQLKYSETLARESLLQEPVELAPSPWGLVK